MGSFSEVVLSFDFSASAQDHVLASVVSLAVPDMREEVPALPAPVVEAWEMWQPDWRDDGYPDGEGDPFENEPWRHDWAFALSTAWGVTTVPHGRLAWSKMGRWNLDCRFSWKTSPVGASDALAWFAPYVELTYPGPTLVGYAHHEMAPRPHLFWVDAGQWVLEDLNRNDDWMWG